MSEPMTSHEIEDVLSSIRRLVSQDLRPAGAPRAEVPTEVPAVPVASARAGDGKLLLTPALRVVGGAEGPSPGARDHDEAGETPATAAAEAGEMPAAGAAEAAAEAAEAPGLWEGREPLWQGGGDPSTALGPEDGDNRPIDLSPAAGAALDEAPMWSDEVAGAWDTPAAGWADEGGEPAAEPPAAAPRPAAADPLARAWADRAEAAVRAELGARAEAEVRARLEADLRAEAEAGALFDEGPGPGMVDEEALREIVRDIIREELAGTLGERITRNVRKLVRVEINRALAAREFE